jgi:decaprenylphospho-beta-D-ribofuranose 2-oxidase
MVELSPAELGDALSTVGPRGAILRGLGRSYGDAAQNGGGLVVRLNGSAEAVVVDREAGTATVPAGVSIDELLRVIVPLGFFVPVTPGTRWVTLGGAVASDIHGKNHHVDGSIGNHVVRLALTLADRSVRIVGPDVEPEVFWATVGGMGLTGAITEVVLRLLPITTSRIAVDTARLPDLDALLAAMSDGDERYRYSVAWIDVTARGAALGRSVLTRGDHARPDQLDRRAAADPLAYDPRQLGTFPPLVPPAGLVHHASVRAFNEVWYRKAPRQRVGEPTSIASFFHPLDAVASWNRVYGAAGLVQYQFVLPFERTDALRAVLEAIAAAAAPSFLSVLKRMGAANPAPLSFPEPGWTLAVDFAGGAAGLADLLHRLDRMILDAGGRHYFAKDSHTTPDVVRRGYPRLAEWQAVQRSLDPHGVWRSDLARRLHLVG